MYSGPSEPWDQDLNDTMSPGNITNFNMTMKIDKGFDVVCSSPAVGNSTGCNKAALGISLSTPILMLSTGVLGNILALLVLYTSKREMKKTIFFPLLLGLAWTDLIGQLCTGPIAILTYANNLKWVGGDELCTYHGFVMVWFGLLTPLIACSMSLERFVALRFSYFYARVATRRMAQYCIVACWIITMFICSFPLMGFGSYEHQFPGSWCFLNFHRESNLDTAYASIFAILNILFIVIMVVCNVTVVVTLIIMRRSRKIINSPSVERRYSVKPKSILQMEIETQMAWFLCAITIVFTTCWLPLNVHIIINQVTGKTDRAKDLISVRLASINQILDPWLYILLRKAMFIKILKRLKGYIFSHKSNSITQKYSHHAGSKTQPSKNFDKDVIDHHHPCLSIASVDCDSTAKLVPVVNTVKTPAPSSPVDKKLPDAGNGDSETDVFLKNEIKENSKNLSKKCRRSFNSCEEKSKSNFPLVQRLNSLPNCLTAEDVEKGKTPNSLDSSRR
ncbi:prostaglandin E2 receptor EP4 subtype isoform X3 [Patella vulgata]|uniref:prostaglandin E2 receptor EP4 subtype isoform X2 n=1 Tax=Patella vulgata TaxID=6465 RepID=UPI0021802C5D|nr:prostaglandin E2 receptor EP4 subtype isoform X2 [Patella vulgata]XP_050402900.1 prostaglandin E2 receptor EP4 subtype isoform X3 [Patella vulgata]